MWDTLKTDALDFRSKFIWLDDYIMNAEFAALEENNCLDAAYKVDLETENLLEILDALKLRNGE